MTRTKKRNAFIAAGGAVVFTVCAGLGVGLHHPKSIAPLSVEQEATLLQTQSPALSWGRASCLAETLINYKADGDRWDRLSTGDRTAVYLIANRQCP